jgi:DNA-binding GntR family transcriptional regulator
MSVQLRAAINRLSLADGVYETLLEAIVSGSLSCGMELNEVSLAKQLEVSRTPVHEAIRRLAADGLIEIGPNRKASVVSFRHDEIAEVYEMRALLESEAARRAAERIDDALIEKLRAAADELSLSSYSLDWREQALAFDIRFHEAIAFAAGNDRLRQDIARYRLLVRALCRITGTLDNLRAALVEHQEILEHIARHDGPGAADAMRRHIERRLTAVLQTKQTA